MGIEEKSLEKWKEIVEKFEREAKRLGFLGRFEAGYIFYKLNEKYGLSVEEIATLCQELHEKMKYFWAYSPETIKSYLREQGVKVLSGEVRITQFFVENWWKFGIFDYFFKYPFVVYEEGLVKRCLDGVGIVGENVVLVEFEDSPYSYLQHKHQTPYFTWRGREVVEVIICENETEATEEDKEMRIKLGDREIKKWYFRKELEKILEEKKEKGLSIRISIKAKRLLEEFIKENLEVYGFLDVKVELPLPEVGDDNMNYVLIE